MSIHEMTRVWDHSEQQKTGLLVLLAIADMANNDGIAWPSQDTIAKRARTTRRSIYTIVKACVEAGEIAYSARRGKQHAYCILVGLDDTERIQRLDLFKEQYPGKVFAGTGIVPVEETSLVPIEKISLVPGEKYAQKRTRSVSETSVDPLLAKNGNGKKQKQDQKPRERDPFFDAICLVCGLDTSKAPGGEVIKVKKRLIKVEWSADDVLKYHAWRQSKQMSAVGSVHFLASEMAKKEWRTDDKPRDYSIGRKGNVNEYKRTTTA